MLTLLIKTKIIMIMILKILIILRMASAVYSSIRFFYTPLLGKFIIIFYTLSDEPPAVCFSLTISTDFHGFMYDCWNESFHIFYLHESFIFFYLHESFTFFLLSFQIFLKPLLALQAYWLNVNSYLQSPLQLVNTLCINIITTNSYNIRLSYQHTQMFSIWDVHTSL